MRHVGNDQFRFIDRVVLVRLDLRQFVDDPRRQIALFDVEDAVIAKQKSAMGFFVS